MLCQNAKIGMGNLEHSICNRQPSLHRFTALISIQFELISSSFSLTLIDISQLMEKNWLKIERHSCVWMAMRIRKKKKKKINKKETLTVIEIVSLCLDVNKPEKRVLIFPNPKISTFALWNVHKWSLDCLACSMRLESVGHRQHWLEWSALLLYQCRSSVLQNFPHERFNARR